MRDTGIADRLRAAGVAVVECDGWQTRGSDSFSPGGSVNHHTAGPASGTTPSLGTVLNGRPDLDGPLANVLQSREPAGPDVAYVIAAGRANHAGSGGWRGLSGNSSVYGLEIEHTGVDPLPAARQDVAARIHAAMFGGDPAMVCQHSEWAPDRKIDAAEGVDPDGFRASVAGAPTRPQEDTLSATEVDAIKAHVTSEANRVITATVDSRPFFARDYDRCDETGEDVNWLVYKGAGVKRWVLSLEAGQAGVADRVHSDGVWPNGYPKPWPRPKWHLDTYPTVGPVPDGWEPELTAYVPHTTPT